jgi:hypothetical protein
MSRLTLEYEPVRDGYTVQPSYPVVETQLKGGLTTKRLEYLYLPHIVTLNWVLTTPQDYTRFMGFFRTSLNGGNDQFLMDLLTDIMVPTTHICRLKGPLPQLTRKKGSSFYVSATFEVVPNPTYSGYILYQEPGNIVFTSTPFLVGPIVTGDFVQIINSEGTNESGVPLNLDGVYEVDSTTGSNTLTLVSPESVNADWTSLAALGAPGEYGDETHGAVFSTVTKVPD